MKNTQVVVVAIFKCGGLSELVDIEYIANEAYKIAPDRFSWKKYADRIDLRVVQDSLKDAKKEKPSKIVGSVRNGFQLTKFGLGWIRELSGNSNIDLVDNTNGVIDNYIEIERLKLKKTSAFKKIVDDRIEDLNKRDYESFVKVNNYFSDELVEMKVQKIINIIDGDKELEMLWENLKNIGRVKNGTN